jgi:hypothetical protein
MSIPRALVTWDSLEREWGGGKPRGGSTMGAIERFKEYTVALEEDYHDDDWSRKAGGGSSLLPSE